MTHNKLLREYNAAEDRVIQEFNSTSFYQQAFPNFNKEEFVNYLFQLGHLSFEFVKFLERTKLALHSETGKEAIRRILRDEIPPKGGTHQDNRIQDLLKIGIPMERILNTLPTTITKNVLENYYAEIQYPQKFYDVHAIVFVRVIGEVLVGETYKHIVWGLEKHFGLKEADSVFYAPHWKHDIKKNANSSNGGHTEYYNLALKELIKNKITLNEAILAAKAAMKIRNQFHSQFIADSQNK